MISPDQIVQILVGILTVLTPVIAALLKRYWKKIARFLELIIKAIDQLKELEDLQRHILEHAATVLQAMKENKPIPKEDVEHIVKHVGEKLELAQQFYTTLRELKRLITG